MYNFGAIFGTLTVIFFSLVTQLSVILMLKTKDLTVGKYESLYEIGYSLLGRYAILIMCSILLLATFGSCTLYFIIFGDTFGSTLRQLILDHDITKVQSEDIYKV